ncbi:MAG: DoxX family protein [Steroidobacteraceae bacterium]
MVTFKGKPNVNASTGTTHTSSYAMVAARVLLVAIFVVSGLSKLGALEATRAYMGAVHVPGALLWPTIVFELGAALLVILGYRTRIIAALLAGFCLVSAVIFHGNFADQMQMIMFLKNVSIAGGFILLASVGAGAFSLDARAGRA